LNGKLQEDKPKLIKFLEVPLAAGRSQLLMAPIKARDDSEASAIYAYLQKYDAEKSAYEKARLLYVAMTRAKCTLHLLGSFANKEDIAATPGSLLETIWPYVKNDFTAAMPQPMAKAALPMVDTIAINRLSLVCVNPIPLSEIQWPDNNVPDYTALDETAIIIGKVMHVILQKISLEGLEAWNTIPSEYCKRLLRSAGLKEMALPAAAEILHTGIRNTLTDTRGRWLFSANHTNSAVEFPLSMVVNGVVQHVILDKTFIDEQNQRWIIDYKTSTLLPEETVADFLQREQQQYRPQLEKYAAVMKQIDRRDKVRLGLYFPLPALWCEWTI
jgi:ATP-dependent helicase/nuclease subunit A